MVVGTREGQLTLPSPGPSFCTSHAASGKPSANAGEPVRGHALCRDDLAAFILSLAFEVSDKIEAERAPFKHVVTLKSFHFLLNLVMWVSLTIIRVLTSLCETDKGILGNQRGHLEPPKSVNCEHGTLPLPLFSVIRRFLFQSCSNWQDLGERVLFSVACSENITVFWPCSPHKPSRWVPLVTQETKVLAKTGMQGFAWGRRKSGLC